MYVLWGEVNVRPLCTCLPDCVDYGPHYPHALANPLRGSNCFMKICVMHCISVALPNVSVHVYILAAATTPSQPAFQRVFVCAQAAAPIAAAKYPA